MVKRFRQKPDEIAKKISGRGCVRSVRFGKSGALIMYKISKKIIFKIAAKIAPVQFCT